MATKPLVLLNRHDYHDLPANQRRHTIVEAGMWIERDRAGVLQGRLMEEYHELFVHRNDLNELIGYQGILGRLIIPAVAKNVAVNGRPNQDYPGWYIQIGSRRTFTNNIAHAAYELNYASWTMLETSTWRLCPGMDEYACFGYTLRYLPDEMEMWSRRHRLHNLVRG